MSEELIVRKPSNVESLEKELEELKAAQTKPVDKEESEIPPVKKEESKESDEPKTGWEKRYGDLRRHTQKQKEELEAKIANLEAKISSTPNLSQPMPKTKEEIDDWVKSNPDLASTIFALVDGQANQKYENITSKLKELEEAQEVSRLEKEKNRVRSVHPDFDKIVDSDDFHDWANGQIKLVQDAIFDGGPEEVIWGLNLYKKEKGIKQTTSERAAAGRVKTPTSDAPSDSPKGRFSESTIEKMSISEYEKNKDAIHAAMKNGTFVYDLTGGAR